MLEERLRKAIKFFRTFYNKSDSPIYRKSVLKFCDLVEEYMGNAPEKVKTIDDMTPQEREDFFNKDEGVLNQP